MRIDVITLHAIKNYGSVLQALATQELFEKKGVEVHIINYIREDALPENIIKTYAKNNPIKRLVMVPTTIRWKKVFDSFIIDNLHVSKKIYSSENDFK